MGANYCFIDDPSETSKVVAWFRELDSRPEETPTDYGFAFYFRELGPLVLHEDGTPDADRCPVVTVHSPKKVRGILWTVGEVHFLPTPLRVLFPPLEKINRSFRTWLGQNVVIYETLPEGRHSFDYYLEGSARNWAEVIYALPRGIAAISSGQYFVSARDSEANLDVICRTLRLRGLECGP